MNKDDVDESLVPCTHEEADTRLFLHAAHASRCGYDKILICIVYTDIVVQVVATYVDLHVSELWIAYGTGNSFTFIPVHEISQSLVPNKCISFLFFHAITGCDTVSAFRGHGRKSAWDTWRVYPEQTGALLLMLSSGTDGLDTQVMAAIERFVILLYDKTSDIVSVNNARRVMFTKKKGAFEKVLPTQDALIEHTKRAG